MRPLIALIALFLSAFATPVREIEAPGLGATKATSMEVCRPEGQRAYLDLLLCTDGSPVAYRRTGSHGPRNAIPITMSEEEMNRLLQRRYAPLAAGEVDHHTIDMYELTCGGKKSFVYMDMYHCDKPAPVLAPKGFTIKGPPAVRREGAV